MPYHYITPDKLHAAAVPCSAPTLQQACLQVGHHIRFQLTAVQAVFGLIGADYDQLDPDLTSTYVDHAVSPTATR